MTASERRALQFQPFAALRGFGEYIRQQERLRCERKEVSDDDAMEISQTLTRLEKGLNAKIRHYTINGYYMTSSGRITEFSYEFRYVVIGDYKIHFDDIYSIEIL